MIRQRLSWLVAGLISLAALPATAETLPGPNLPSLPVVTSHEGVFNGKHIAYQAVVEGIDVNDADGKPGAHIVTFSYLATGSSARRPVLFAFNGGPITASNMLHMGMLGPKRVAIPDDPQADPSTYHVVDNRYTVLDVADIVFFDPASTGFSRVAEGVDPKKYFSVTSDAQQLAQLIVEWSKRHHRLTSPKFVLGESYGTMRAAAVANQLQKLPTPVPLNGVILIGQALNIIEFSQRPANIISYVASLPTIAAIAWSHGKADIESKTFDQFMQEVFLFARTDYLTALYQGDKLDEPTRQLIAAKLSRYTGLPASYYLANKLEITKERYRRELFKGEILGMTDGRYLAPISSSSSPEEAHDPAGVISHAYSAAFKDYLRGDLKVDGGDYLEVAKNTAGLSSWGWDGSGTSPFADWPYPTLLSEVFAANPDFRVMVDNGYEDTQTTVGAAQYLVDRSGWPADRVDLHFYQGGHMAYSIEDSLRRMTDDVRAFIRGK